MAIDYKDAVVTWNDQAVREIQGYVSSQAAQFQMVQLHHLALRICDRELKMRSYPLAQVQFKINRDAFRLEPGDLFRWSYAPYSISNMILRVVTVDEESLQSEDITVTAVEDVDYITTEVDVTDPDVIPDPGDPPDAGQFYEVDPLVDIAIQEAPWVLVGENIGIVALAGRIYQYELGYYVYMSIDGGTSYKHIGVVNLWNPHGTLVADYPADTNDIDDEVGFEIDATNADMEGLNSISRTDLFTNRNLAILGDEIISFQTITPHETEADRYVFSGINRGRYDTVPQDHAADEDFFFINENYANVIVNIDMLYGQTAYFKFVPYSSRDVGDIADATPLSVTFDGRAYTPYHPINLKVNDVGVDPTYEDDCVLSWYPRKRGEGAGVGDPDVGTDADPVWEGYFKVVVKVSDVIVRTTEGIDAITWTYTEAMNLSDNGSLASSVTFELTNYIDLAGFRYESNVVEITATLA